MIAPRAAPPPTLVVLLLVCDSPWTTNGCTVTLTIDEPARMVLIESCSSPESLNRPDGVADSTRPVTCAPRGITVRPELGSTTSLSTVPVNRSPCCEVSLESDSFTRTSILLPVGN
jgi:hypothetical protein